MEGCTLWYVVEKKRYRKQFYLLSYIVPLYRFSGPILKLFFFNSYQSQFKFEVIHNPIVRVKIVFLKYGLGVSIQISGCG